MSLTGTNALSDEPDSDGEHFSDHASPTCMVEEGEVSDLESASPDCEELLDVDQGISAKQTYRGTIHGVRLFMGWNQVPEFDSSSSLDDNPLAGTRAQQATEELDCLITFKWSIS